MRATLLLALLSILAATLLTVLSPRTEAGPSPAAEPTATESRRGPPLYHVLIHAPGPGWQEGISPFRQPGIQEHVAWFEKQAEEGRLVLGGPFMDDAAGGMMVLKTATREEAEAVGRQDPAVQSELLKVRVRPWLVPLQGTSEETPPQTTGDDDEE